MKQAQSCVSDLLVSDRPELGKIFLEISKKNGKKQKGLEKTVNCFYHFSAVHLILPTQTRRISHN